MFIAMTLAGLHPLSADEPTDVSSTIQILSAYAEPAPAGACTEVRFKLKNDGREDLQVIGLVTDVASSARLLVQVGSQETVVLDSFGVPSEQTVDFTHSRWFELCGLTRPLQTGQAFFVELQTARWSTSLVVHVH